QQRAVQVEDGHRPVVAAVAVVAARATIAVLAPGLGKFGHQRLLFRPPPRPAGHHVNTEQAHPAEYRHRDRHEPADQPGPRAPTPPARGGAGRPAPPGAPRGAAGGGPRPRPPPRPHPAPPRPPPRPPGTPPARAGPPAPSPVPAGAAGPPGTAPRATAARSSH